MGSVYPLDFLAKTLQGRGFQVQKRITLAASGTTYVVLDLGLVEDTTCIFGFPVVAGTTSGHVHLDTYSCDSYTAGDSIEVNALNPKKGSNVATLSEATAPVGQYHLREYSIGTESTRQDSGGGFITSDNIKMLDNKPLVFEFINQETSETAVSFGYVWFECD